MKKFGLFLTGLTFATVANAQTLTIQSGTSISKLDWKLKGVDSNLFNEKLVCYSLFTGINYLEKKFLNLSSNVGMIRKGGKSKEVLTDINGNLTGETIIEKPTLSYLSLNTTIDLKYEVRENVYTFLSIGPRWDYLVSKSNHFNTLEEIDALENTSYGLILGSGLRYNIFKIQLSLRTDYYLELTKVANWTIDGTGVGGSVIAKTITINLTVGYKL